MHNKKLVLAACVLMSIGLLYGANGNIGSVAKAATTKTTAVAATTTKAKEIAMVKLPKGIEGMKAETKANAKLEALIQKQFGIPNSDLAQTTYYYNYVDLNGDGKKEIFAVVNGSYTSGSGGSTALWISDTNGTLKVTQKFTLVNVPVIISNSKTNGRNDLIVPYYGGGAKTQYKVLKFGKSTYSTINASKSIKSLDGIKGKAIVANDLLKEVQNGQSGIQLKAAKTEVPMVKLPKGIEGVKAETKANAKLEALIKKEYDIPKEELSKTSYYYNYVNLNDKGNKQIFVVISGPYTSGSGGNSALLVGESDGKMYVSQRFTLVNVPVIISDNKTNGLHDIIIPYYGGGATSQYKVLKAGETSYSTINDSKSIKSLDGIKGKAIITNDILKEIENGQSGIKLK